MAGLLNNFCITGFNNGVVPKSSTAVCSLRFKESNPRKAPFLITSFKGKQLLVPEDSGDWRSKAPGNHLSVHVCLFFLFIRIFIIFFFLFSPEKCLLLYT